MRTIESRTERLAKVFGVETPAQELLDKYKVSPIEHIANQLLGSDDADASIGSLLMLLYRERLKTFVVNEPLLRELVKYIQPVAKVTYSDSLHAEILLRLAVNPAFKCVSPEKGKFRILDKDLSAEFTLRDFELTESDTTTNKH